MSDELFRAKWINATFALAATGALLLTACGGASDGPTEELDGEAPEGSNEDVDHSENEEQEEQEDLAEVDADSIACGVEAGARAPESLLGMNSFEKPVVFHAVSVLSAEAQESDRTAGGIDMMRADGVHPDYLGMMLWQQISEHGGAGGGASDIEEYFDEAPDIDESLIGEDFIESVSIYTWTEEDASDCELLAGELEPEQHSLYQSEHSSGDVDAHHWVVEFPGDATEYWDENLAIAAVTSSGQEVAANMRWNVSSYWVGPQRDESPKVLDGE